MGGSSAEKNAVFGFLLFGETPSSASEVSPGGRNYGGRNPPSFAGSTVEGHIAFHRAYATRTTLHVSWCVEGTPWAYVMSRLSQTRPGDADYEKLQAQRAY